jgi:hypothetical protein
MFGSRYTDTFTVPRAVAPGRVLAHNHVRHTVDMPQGLNGFRSWTWPKAKKLRTFVRCACGYAGLPHVAIRDHARSYKCESWETIRSFGA